MKSSISPSSTDSALRSRSRPLVLHHLVRVEDVVRSATQARAPSPRTRQFLRLLLLPPLKELGLETAIAEALFLDLRPLVLAETTMPVGKW